MTNLLIQPPFADPTQPYLALPTLKAWLRRHGHDATVVDLNLEAAHFLLDPAEVTRFLARDLIPRLRDLERSKQIDQHEYLELHALRKQRPRIEALAVADPPPLRVMRDGELFYDPSAYETARGQIEDLLEARSAPFSPFRFGFNRADNGERPWAFSDLERRFREARSPLHDFYLGVFAKFDCGVQVPRIELSEVGFIGISVVFPSQIPEAFYLCGLLRQLAPTAFIALGGPCLHQAAIYMDEDRRRRLLSFVDGVGLYEGEATTLALIERVEALRAVAEDAERAALLADVPNLLSLDADGNPRVGPPHSLDMKEAAPPDYSDLDLDRYLAPSRVLLYAPTRGCYWDQCSFCYYGLSDTATARYREVPPEQAAAELKQLARRFGARNFYLSCDVLSPAYAVKLAEALIAQKVNIKWSSDLKIERYFTRERCELLHRSGLRSVALGIESGSDRILTLMRKGVDRQTMTAVNRSFHDAGVATEWMTFTDHPGETMEEAEETISWIRAEADHVDLFIVGTFGMQPGSDIAQRPEHYGVRSIFYDEADDFRLYAQWHPTGRARTKEEHGAISHRLELLAQDWALHAYPWAGANSTHHSFLQFIRYGQRVFRTHFRRAVVRKL